VSEALEPVAALAGRWSLDRGAAGRLAALVGVLADDPGAPTTIRAPERAVEAHLADSLVALDLTVVRHARRALDLGSGAGFPGLPLAIALPRTEFALVESSAPKCAFLERAVAECGISNADVVHTRAEAVPGHLGHSDLVIARALASLEVTAEYAAPLLRVGGAMVAWRGRRDSAAELTLERASAQLGLGAAEVLRMKPYPAAEHRHLYVVPKLAETPARFPRRPGVALKRPLGRDSSSDRVEQ